MDSIPIKILNELLSSLPNNSHLEFVTKTIIHETHGRHEDQGELGEYFEIYKILNTPVTSDLHLKIMYKTDSYGSDDFICGVEFVTPKLITIKVFE